MVPVPLRKVLLIGYVLLLWLVLLNLPAGTAAPASDPSWRSMLGYDYLAGLSVSGGSTFSYGPLGYFSLTVSDYIPELFLGRLVVEFVGKLVVSLLLVATMLRIEGWVGRGVALAILVVVAPDIGVSAYLLAMVAATLLTLERARISPFWYGLCFALVALLGAAKHTMLVMGAVCSVALYLQAWRLGGWRAAGLALLAHLAIAMAVWIGFVGQSPGELPFHLYVAYQVIEGYNQTLVSAGPLQQVVLAALATLGLLSGLALIGWKRPGRFGDWLQLLVLAFAGLLSWKYCVVHQGAGQAAQAFGSLLVLVCMMLPLARRSGLGRGPMLAVAIPSLLCALIGLGDALRLMPGGRESEPVAQLPGRVYRRAVFDWRYLSLGKVWDLQEAVRADYMRRYALPGIRQRVGSATVDQMGHEQAIMFLNELEVHHRPAFQNYFANTAFLQRRNGEFLAAEDGPEFVIFKLQTVHRYLDTLLDGTALLELLHRYRPVMAERPVGPTTELPRLANEDYLLFERRAEAGAQRPVEILSTRAFTFGEWHEPGVDSEDLLTARLFVGLSAWGALRANLYQAPILHIEVRLDDGTTLRGRFSTTAGRGEFLLSPMVTSSDDFVALYTGEKDLPKVRALRLVAEDGQRGCFADEVSIQIGSQPLPGRVAEISGRQPAPADAGGSR